MRIGKRFYEKVFAGSAWPNLSLRSYLLVVVSLLFTERQNEFVIEWGDGHRELRYRLLKDSTMPCREIAGPYGFSIPAHFAGIRNEMGMTPRQFRESGIVPLT